MRPGWMVLLGWASTAMAGTGAGWDGPAVALGPQDGRARDHLTVALGPGGAGVAAYEEADQDVVVVVAAFSAAGEIYPERVRIDGGRRQTHPQVGWTDSGPWLCWSRASTDGMVVAWRQLTDRGHGLGGPQRLRTPGDAWMDNSYCDVAEVQGTRFVTWQGGQGMDVRPHVHLWAEGMNESVAWSRALGVVAGAAGTEGMTLVWAENYNRDRIKTIRVAEIDATGMLVRGPVNVAWVHEPTLRVDITEVAEGYAVSWVEDGDAIMLARLGPDLGVKSVDHVADGQSVALASADGVIGMTWAEVSGTSIVYRMGVIDYQQGRWVMPDQVVASGSGSFRAISDIDLRMVDGRIRGVVGWQLMHNDQRNVFVRFFTGE